MFLQEVVKQIICKNRSLSFFPLLLNAVKKKALFQSPAPKTAVPSEVKATAWLSNSGFGSSRIEKKKKTTGVFVHSPTSRTAGSCTDSLGIKSAYK